MSKLISLTYKSDALDNISEQVLIDILSSARDYNTRVGITGMLLYGQGKFFQCLEGPADLVKALFNDKISRDDRHRNVVILTEREIDEREFPNWSMGFQWTNGCGDEEFAMLNAGPQAHEIMRRIKKHMIENRVDMAL
ncbi:BLUF domain-containing protein [Cerasicoccus fimbriatus]|uniref:BLUF domain-containing protein n=1 Tax=Cerasicoccus fimbriatus TaxID=3014554 RepID=UPI0022B317FD|nr:BLUF domain-containing protein [Cerasicoccus sp. TK19100]